MRLLRFVIDRVGNGAGRSSIVIVATSLAVGLLMSLSLGAAACASSPVLGITFTHFELDLKPGRSCHGLDRTAPLRQGGIIPQYDVPGVRDRVRTQLSQTRKNGFRSIRVMIWFRPDAKTNGSGLLSSTEPDFSRQGLRKIMEFVSDIRSAGFERLTVVFAASGANRATCRTPSNADCFEPRFTDLNWNFIEVTKRGVDKAAAGMELQYDLALEHCPSRYLPPGKFQVVDAYLRELIQRYDKEFGHGDMLVSCADGPGRVSEILRIFDQIGIRPKYVDNHIYETDPKKLRDRLDAVARELAGTKLKLILGEVPYHNEAQAAVLSDFVNANPGLVVEIVQWPAKNLDNECAMDSVPPFSPGPLQDALKLPGR